MAGKIVDDIALTEDGKNIFHEISSLQALACAYAGFSTMCWEHPELAGNLNTEELNAGVNSFVQRATQILWTRIYQHLFEVMSARLQELNPGVSEESIRQEVQVLCQGMDLWR